MKIQSFKAFHPFEREQDLLYKSNSFVRNLEDLERLAKNLNTLILDETSSSKGKIIKKINSEIEEETRNCQLYYNASRNFYGKEYTELVNDMNVHPITVYYEVIDMRNGG
jgi:phage host-nuclease inhibitor protein Gam